MASTIKLKRSEVAGNPAALAAGELAYSSWSGAGGNRLYVGMGAETAGDAANHFVIGGTYFTNMMDHTPGVLSASSAILTDASSKVDHLIVDNIDFNLNTISTTNTNGSLFLSPNGTGSVDVSTSRITSVTDPTALQDAATKNYVDTVAGAKILNFAGQTGTDALNLTDSALSVVGYNGLSTAVTNNKITISAANAVANGSTKGVATFNATNFNSSNGVIASAPVTIGSTAINLGGTNTALAGLTQVDVANVRISGNTVSSTTGTLYLDPFPIGADSGDLVIRGNLTVQGTTTTINSTVTSIKDINMVLADSAVGAVSASGAGLTIGGANYTGVRPTMTYDGATDRWDFNKPIEVPFGIASGMYFNGVSITEALEDHFVTNFFLGGTAISLTYDDPANNLTIAANVATTGALGVARFDAAQMSVASGLVSITTIDGGTY